MMPKLVDNKDLRILVSGAFCGIGWSLVRYLLNLGYFIIAVDKAPPTKSQANMFSKNLDRIQVITVDFLQKDAYQRLESSISEGQKPLAGLFAYAGITPIASIENSTEQIFDEVMDINLRSSFFLTQIFLRHYDRDTGGSIVYCGSPHQYSGDRDRAAYAISKGALITLNQHVAIHHASDRVRSNILIPGWTRTEGEINLRKEQGMAPSDLASIVHATTPIRRFIEPYEYDELIEFLLSPKSALVTGSIIDSTGGLRV